MTCGECGINSAAVRVKGAGWGCDCGHVNLNVDEFDDKCILTIAINPHASSYEIRQYIDEIVDEWKRSLWVKPRSGKNV